MYSYTKNTTMDWAGLVYVNRRGKFDYRSQKLKQQTWQESSTPFPAQIILAVILCGRYFEALHCASDRIGTWTSWTTSARFPPSDKRPQPGTVPNFPDGSRANHNKTMIT